MVLALLDEHRKSQKCATFIQLIVLVLFSTLQSQLVIITHEQIASFMVLFDPAYTDSDACPWRTRFHVLEVSALLGHVTHYSDKSLENIKISGTGEVQVTIPGIRR